MSYLYDITFPGWHDAGKGEEQQVPCERPAFDTGRWPSWAIAPDRNLKLLPVDRLDHLTPASEIETQIPACELQSPHSIVGDGSC